VPRSFGDPHLCRRQLHLIDANKDYAQELRAAGLTFAAIGWPVMSGFRHYPPAVADAIRRRAFA
jgi:hypothetical protein